MIQTINPYTKEVLNTYSFLTEKELLDKIESSHQAFKKWEAKSYIERQHYILQLGILLENHATEYASTIVQEMGKPLTEATTEVRKCALLCRYYGNLDIETLTVINYKLDDYQEAQTIYQPLGIILGIMPWNFPFWQVLRYAVPTLLMGNTTLLKHAPNTIQCGILIEELFIKAGFPIGIFQNLVLDIPQVETVIAHPFVQGVTLTGSERAGSSVASLAGKYLKKSVLELGGSDPFIVFEDADLDIATSKGVLSRFLNSGQVCIAAKRFILHHTIAETFIEQFITKIQELHIGNPMAQSTQLSLMAREDLAIQAEKQIQKALSQGAKLLLGGKRKENFIEPTVLHVSSDHPILQEEIFAPIALIITAKNDHEILSIANDTTYGLGASIWTQNIKKAHELALKIEAGTVAINEIVLSDPRLPFGGIKNSGYGRELAVNALFEFVNVKTVYRRGEQ
ncbi:succinylglutamate-semialdehyde dehydrogenase [Flavobacteriaceae bacterium UJ101]|nr:succinylglutamate-semialdehyde dehydrogenase [Flavobacteriaceae bacterium UJ101]